MIKKIWHAHKWTVKKWLNFINSQLDDPYVCIILLIFCASALLVIQGYRDAYGN